MTNNGLGESTDASIDYGTELHQAIFSGPANGVIMYLGAQNESFAGLVPASPAICLSMAVTGGLQDVHEPRKGETLASGQKSCHHSGDTTSTEFLWSLLSSLIFDLIALLDANISHPKY